MDWVKKNWVVLVCGLVAIGGIAVGVMAKMGFGEVQARANEVAGLANTLKGLDNPSSAANVEVIRLAKADFDTVNAGARKARDEAVQKTRRPFLHDGVFPAPKTINAPYEFRHKYREAMRQLPQDLRAESAPTGTTVDRIVSRLVEKAKRAANVNVVGENLSVPKPPVVPQIQPMLPAAASTGMMDDRTMRGGRGEDPMRGSGRGEDPMRAGPAYGAPSPMPLVPTSPLLPAGRAQPPVKVPTAEELLPEARERATRETAQRIWTYIDEGSLQVHPIGYPEFQQAPDEVDMWGAQVFYWIEKDVVDALYRVNKQAAEALPEDQRWVAYLPVKHLVGLSISEYITAGVTTLEGRATAIELLHRQSRTGGYTRGAGASAARMGSISFGSSSVAYTGRTRTEQYDVVHFAVSLVIDARDLPKILKELCLQNFITPLNVQYRKVDVQAARNAGYLYGSGPVTNVEIVCEILFFRAGDSDYEKNMPQMVKDILSGNVQPAMPGMRGAY